MTAPTIRPPDPTDHPDPGAPEPLRLRLSVVRTPHPPLEDPRTPLRLVRPGIPPRPPYRPGPRTQPRRTSAVDGGVNGGVDGVDFGPTLSRRGELPDPGESGRRLVQLTLEALAGHRPLAQLEAVTTAGVFIALRRGRRPRWCVEGSAPLLLGPVRVCEPVDGVVEISAVARRGGRAHAVAARLEGIDGRWRCTALQIG